MLEIDGRLGYDAFFAASVRCVKRMSVAVVSAMTAISHLSLDSDLTDAVTLAAPPAAAMEQFLKVLHQIITTLAEALPHHRVVPYGSFVTGTMVRGASDLDVTLVGPGHDHHSAVLAASALSARGEFAVRARPVPHTQSRPLLRFTHHATGVRGDLTFNEASAIRATGVLSAMAQRHPVGAMATVLIKAAMAGEVLPPTALTSVAIAVCSFGVVSHLRQCGQLDEDPSLADVVLAFTRFFGYDFADSGPHQIIVSLSGIHRSESSRSPFLTWHVLDPATQSNVAERCTQVADFASLMRKLHDALAGHYPLNGRHRLAGSAHALQLLPCLDPGARFATATTPMPPLAAAAPRAAFSSLRTNVPVPTRGKPKTQADT
jgi:hypothetical protein